MRDDGVASVDDAGVVAALIEHTEVQPQHGSVVNIPAYGAFVRRDAHEAVLVQLDVGETLGERFQHLIGGEIVVEAHHGHGVLHSGIVRVEGDDVAHAHVVELVEHKRAVQRLSARPSVLPALVEHGHDHGDALGFAVRGADDALEIRKMLVGSHRDLLAVEVVGDAVVRHIANDEEVLASERLHHHRLALAVGETGIACVDDESVLLEGAVHIHRLIPFDQIFVYEFGEFTRAGSGNESERTFRSCGAQCKFRCHGRPP